MVFAYREKIIPQGGKMAKVINSIEKAFDLLELLSEKN